ncbi:MAG: Wzz/FepE/Etk N-terminal domain-containing protein [Burkholderiales bacterium]|nr:Wzz/FepE/Etk N-terminal domain-containing protein [Burkholderiales bacterium]
MNEQIAQLMSLLRGVWRRRWLVLGVTWLVCIVGWVWIYLLQNEYRASARVYVDTQSLLRPLLQGLTIQPNFEQQVAMMTRTLISRPNLEKVARMTDLDIRAKDAKALEALYADLAKRIQLEGTTRENLYTIGFVHANPELSKRVVQALLTIFTEQSLGSTRRDLTNTQKFLDDQIKAYEAKLQEKEQQIEEFKRRNVGQMPGQGGGFFARIEALNQTLRETHLQLQEAVNRKKQLQQQLAEQEETISTPLLPPSVVAANNSLIDNRIAALQTQLDNLKLRFTDLHPEVQRVKGLIASLQQQKAKEEEEARAAEAARAKENPVAAKAQNPVYQQLTIAIAEADATVASLRARVQQLERERAELMRKIDLLPQLENELAQLMRDYDIYKSNYSTLLARRESAVMTGEVEAKTDTVEFRVIDPPRVETKPAWPNRPLLITVTPLAGMGAGVALAFLLAQMRPTVDNRRQLQQLAGLPVLGVVSRVETDASRRHQRRMTLAFIAGVGLLLMAYAVLMVYYLFLSPAA